MNAIVSQQLSGKAADTIFGRLEALGGGTLPGPAELLAIPDEVLRAAGLSGAKTRGVKDLAARVLAGTLDLDTLHTRDDEAVIETLTQVKGIGRWTAEMFLMFRLGRLDVLSTADLGVRKGMMMLFGLRELPDPKTMERLAESWRPFRSVGCWYLWRAAENAPPVRRSPAETVAPVVARRAAAKKVVANKAASARVKSKTAPAKQVAPAKSRAGSVLAKRVSGPFSLCSGGREIADRGEHRVVQRAVRSYEAIRVNQLGRVVDRHAPERRRAPASRGEHRLGAAQIPRLRCRLRRERTGPRRPSRRGRPSRPRSRTGSPSGCRGARRGGSTSRGLCDRDTIMRAPSPDRGCRSCGAAPRPVLRLDRRGARAVASPSRTSPVTGSTSTPIAARPPHRHADHHRELRAPVSELPRAVERVHEEHAFARHQGRQLVRACAARLSSAMIASPGNDAAISRQRRSFARRVRERHRDRPGPSSRR